MAPIVRCLSVLLIWPALLSGQSSTGRLSGGSPGVQTEQVVAATRANFGATVVPWTEWSPFFLQADFNGDGRRDLAVIVHVDGAQADLRKHGVKYVNIDPYSKSNGSQADLPAELRHCLGIVISHGSAIAQDVTAQKFIVYECFSSMKLHAKGRRIERGGGSLGPTPVPRGDSLVLDLETGGSALVYWDGKTYKSFGLRDGD